ncbi:PREDICTED: myoneurin-like [Rhagoletis zephyria]|uniref:myoneurin-like n=1 Tax=Rhagoletis zephyria TaxID=28612 RepID=UPI0008113684|nr:PREDICTED: myoneurin-like [Rhagoletis zephyria]
MSEDKSNETFGDSAIGNDTVDDTIIFVSSTTQRTEANSLIWDEKDAEAQAFIMRGIELEQLKYLTECTTAAQMWSKLKIVHSEKSEQSAQVLLEKFINCKMDLDESIVNYVARVVSLAQRLKDMDMEQKQPMVIAKMLSSLPSKYDHVRTAWYAVPRAEQNIERLTDHLVNEESLMNLRSAHHVEDDTVKTAYSVNKFNKKPKMRTKRSGSCNYCHKEGHWARECFKKQREPDAAQIKQEYSDPEEAEVLDIYVPIDEEEEVFEEFDTIDRSASAMSDGVEYLEEINEFQYDDDDEDYVQIKEETPKRGRGRPPKNLSRPEASTSKQAAARQPVIKKEKCSPAKRGPKPKKIKPTTYICDICGNIYPSQGRLTEHIKLHKGIKPHECEICGHCFAQTQQLTRHMNTHTGNRPYKCSYCPAAFADLSTRNKHHRIHTNERPYVCDVCGKSFTYTNTLKFHKMIHTGEKPHVCDICGKGFQQAYKLRNHKMTHERKGVGIKMEPIEVEALESYQEVNPTATQVIEI